MEPRLLKIAEEIVSRSDRAHPADSVLRAELKRTGNLSRDDGRNISRAVFAYFRWLGFLDATIRASEKILSALKLADQFSVNPQAIGQAELGKAVPAWINGCMQVSAEWLRALQSEPKLWLRTKRDRRNELSKSLGDCFPLPATLLHDALEYRGSKDLFRTAEFHEGVFELQDISSQAVGVICHPKPGETWWDACAGEGGKLLHLSELMENKGLIWASDRAEWRLKKLKQRAARAKSFNYRAALWDGGSKLPTKTKFDGVLVDAPCSGIGTWQRNPHARWTTSLSDVCELAETQRALLLNVADSIKPGGQLIYSVCTLSHQETIEVAKFFLEQRRDFEPMEKTNPFRPGETASQFWFGPQDVGGNGMFVSCWRKL